MVVALIPSPVQKSCFGYMVDAISMRSWVCPCLLGDKRVSQLPALTVAGISSCVCSIGPCRGLHVCAVVVPTSQS